MVSQKQGIMTVVAAGLLVLTSSAVEARSGQYKPFSRAKSAGSCDVRSGQLSGFAAKNPQFNAYLGSLLQSYKKNNMPLASCSIYKAQQVVDQKKLVKRGRDPMLGNLRTNAPLRKSSDAYVVVLNRKDSTLQDLAVYDPVNAFKLQRDFSGDPAIRNSPSRFGDARTGTVLFIKSKNIQSVFKPSYITRANMDLDGQQVRLLKWKVGLLFNKYSHDYTLKLQNQGTFDVK